VKYTVLKLASPIQIPGKHFHSLGNAKVASAKETEQVFDAETHPTMHSRVSIQEENRIANFVARTFVRHEAILVGKELFLHDLYVVERVYKCTTHAWVSPRGGSQRRAVRTFERSSSSAASCSAMRNPCNRKQHPMTTMSSDGNDVSWSEVEAGG